MRISAASTSLDKLTAIVDLAAIANNVEVLTEHAGGKPVMAVVKADGYGHGAVEVARAATTAGATELAVATIDEALALRSAGIDQPILAWLSTTGYEEAIQADIRLGVSSPRQLAKIAGAARSTGRAANIDVKVDTGLSRNGIGASEWQHTRSELARAKSEGSIRVHGVFTHLAHADEPNHPFLDVQRDRLSTIVADMRAHGVAPTVVHAANSAATLTRPDLRFDMVRPGIAIYGRSPIPNEDFGLRPAMTLAAPVILIKRLTSGDGVSYSHTWTAPVDTVVGLIPAGYADGVPRTLSGQLEVSIGGGRFPGIGRVCMDQFIVDLGPDGGSVAEGDTAILFGDDRRGEPTASDWSRAAGTIDYEILTGVHGRREIRYVRQANSL